MTRSPATSTNVRSRSSLTLENLESLPKNNRFVDSFVSEQRRNAQFHADEALSFIDQPSTITSKQRTNHSKSNRITSPLMLPASPLLKSRLEMQQEFLADVDATPSFPKKSQPKELFKGFKHARNDLMDEKKVASKSKRPRSPSDDEEERSARLKERRDRKRARNEIIKPRVVTPEQSLNGDSDAETQHKQTKKSNRKKLEEEPETELTIRKKKGRGKAAAGISLMETFTATNVKKSRLTLQPQNSSKLFKQARSGEAVKLGKKKIENERSASKYSKPSAPVRKSKPNPLETYSKHALNAPKQAKASYNFSKNRPKSIQSATDSFLSDDSDADHAVEHEQRHKGSPSPLDTESDAEADGCATYSESWGIGSQLPSDASSVHICITPRKATKVAHVAITPSRASTVSSEPKITTLTTPWNFEDPQSAFGRFETLDQGHPRIPQEKGGSIPTTGQDYATPARSRFFFSPLVPIPEHVQNAVPNPGRMEYVDSAAQPADARDSAIHQSDPEYTEVVADERQTENGMAAAREPSPVDSLDRLLHQHDAEDALYGHLFVLHEKRRSIQKLPCVQTAQEYYMESEPAMTDQLDNEAYQHETNEAFNSCHSEDSNGNFSGYGEVATNDSVWEECEQGYFYETETGEPEEPVYYENCGVEDDVCQPGTYSDMDAADFVEDAGSGDEGEVWQDVIDGEVWEAEEGLELFEAQGADVLPFAEGRILLLGLGNDAHLSRPLGPTGTRAPHSSTYGQSVQEIEVMAARQLGHYW